MERLNPAREKAARDIAFVLRCAAAATLSYVLGTAIGLPHPIWACMSAIIVSQDRLDETRMATVSRLLGTSLGIAVAVVVGALTRPANMDMAGQIALAVGVSAVAARRYPSIRICMWTCPIVFLSSNPATSYLVTGVYRGVEVILGVVVGALLHLIAEATLVQLFCCKQR